MRAMKGGGGGGGSRDLEVLSERWVWRREREMYLPKINKKRGRKSYSAVTFVVSLFSVCVELVKKK